MEEGITFISAKNVINGKLNFDDVKHISEDEYEEIQRRCNTEYGDVLLTKSGTLGLATVVDTEKKIGLFESLAVIKYFRDKLDGLFLCEQLKSSQVQSQLQDGIKGVAVKHLHLNVIGDVDIIVPPLEKQQMFSQFIHQVDKSEFEEVLRLKRLSVCFLVLAVLLSDIMCAAVAWNYCDMLWGIDYAGYSAPASTAFLIAIPYSVGIVICIALAIFFKKKFS